MTRVALGKKHLATAAGESLLRLLMEITKDGELSLEEIDQLRSWLDANAACSDVPAIAWLRELVQAVLADGKITKEERIDLLVAFDRVLPPEERLVVKARRRNAVSVAGEDADEDSPPRRGRKTRVPWQDQPATEKQFAYMEYLGIAFDEATITKGQASKLITAATDQSKRPPSNRQMMVLRFWNRTELAASGKEAVSEWLDSFYRQDARHREAWERWKSENGDDGGQGDPSRVPIGAGFGMLHRSYWDSAWIGVVAAGTVFFIWWFTASP